MKSILGEAWTLAGVLLVIITLSGEVRTQAIVISTAALLLWFAGNALDRDDEEEDRESGNTAD